MHCLERPLRGVHAVSGPCMRLSLLLDKRGAVRAGRVT